jgi:hypothetical protein
MENVDGWTSECYSKQKSDPFQCLYNVHMHTTCRNKNISASNIAGTLRGFISGGTSINDPRKPPQHRKFSEQLIPILFLKFRNWTQESQNPDRHCGLVVRVLGYRSGGPGSIPGATRFSGGEKRKENSSGSGTGSTQPREYNWGATW